MILTCNTSRLGESLFQYCLARVLASRWGYRLRALPLVGFSGTFATIKGEEIISPTAAWQGQWPFDAHSGRPIHEGELLIAPMARLALKGEFQRFAFISEVKDLVREEWLRPDETEPMRSSGDFAICLPLHDRTTESEESAADCADDPRLDSALGEEEVRTLVRRVRHRRLFLLTDRPSHPLITALHDLRPNVISRTKMEEFRFIHSCQKVAISQDVLQWWAAFLGRAREIYFPRIDRGPWSDPAPAKFFHDPKQHGIDLRVRNEDRWIYDW